jgi:hypothetical protein
LLSTIQMSSARTPSPRTSTPRIAEYVRLE